MMLRMPSRPHLTDLLLLCCPLLLARSQSHFLEAVAVLADLTVTSLAIRLDCLVSLQVFIQALSFLRGRSVHRDQPHRLYNLDQQQQICPMETDTECEGTCEEDTQMKTGWILVQLLM